MLTQLDTAIGVAVVMSIVSLLVMVVAQMVSALLGLRGKNLADALEVMFHKLQPDIHALGCKRLVDAALTHPAVSDTTLSLRAPDRWWRRLPVVHWFLLRWSRSNAVRPDELAQVLRQLASSPVALARQLTNSMHDSLATAADAAARRNLDAAARAPIMAALAAADDAASTIAAADFAGATKEQARFYTERFPLAMRSLCERFSSCLPVLSALGVPYPRTLPQAPDQAAKVLTQFRGQFERTWIELGHWSKQHHALLVSRAATELRTVLQAAEADGEKFEKWFNSVQDRAQQWFTVHTRAVTVVGAVLAALVLQLDAVELVRSLSSDPQLRARLIARADALQQQEHAVAAGPNGDVLRQAALGALKAAHSNWQLPPEAPAGPGGVDPRQWLKATDSSSGKLVDSNELLADFNQEWDRALLREDAHVIGDIDQLANSATLSLLPQSYPIGIRPGWPGVRWYSPFVLTAKSADGAWLLRRGLGLFISAALLSLGAPFWFNLLKQLSSLRSALAEAVDDQPKQASGNPVGGRPS